MRCDTRGSACRDGDQVLFQVSSQACGDEISSGNCTAAFGLDIYGRATHVFAPSIRRNFSEKPIGIIGNASNASGEFKMRYIPLSSVLCFATLELASTPASNGVLLSLAHVGAPLLWSGGPLRQHFGAGWRHGPPRAGPRIRPLGHRERQLAQGLQRYQPRLGQAERGATQILPISAGD